MKITFLGAGALRLLGAVDEILQRPEVFGTTELVFMDIVEENAKMMAALTEKMPSFLPSKFIVKAIRNSHCLNRRCSLSELSSTSFGGHLG